MEIKSTNKKYQEMLVQQESEYENEIKQLRKLHEKENV